MAPVDSPSHRGARRRSLRLRRAARGVGLGLALLASPGLPGGPGAAAGAEGKDIFGWVERVELGAHEIELKAKLDTGAETSSLDASNIRRLRRVSSGERLVEFQLRDPQTGEAVTLKKPLVREVRIKQHDGSFQGRPVVKLAICLGDHQREIEVNLIDRSEFLYPMLLGRKALKRIAVVDPDRTFTQDPDCDGRRRSR